MLRYCVTVVGFELEGGHLVATYERKKCSLNFSVGVSRARGTDVALKCGRRSELPPFSR